MHKDSLMTFFKRVCGERGDVCCFVRTGSSKFPSQDERELQQHTTHTKTSLFSPPFLFFCILQFCGELLFEGRRGWVMGAEGVRGRSDSARESASAQPA